MKECEYCKIEFEPTSGKQRFCTKSCYRTYGKKVLGHSKGDKVQRNKRTRLKQNPYRKVKKELCELCGFVPIHPCQLDVDHVDGDHTNNNLINLQTLCANCHRLKTYQNRDWQ